jgi:inorganic phosphate transporter, PiT family
LFGVAVATTIGHEVVSDTALSLPVIGSALSAAVIWNVLTWRTGIPSSSSHALIGGLIGGAFAAHGLASIQLGGLVKVLVALFISPPLGLVVGYLAMKLILWLADVFSISPRINRALQVGQWVTATWLALSHGANDGQKTMGIMTMVLLATGALTKFEVPFWVIGVSAAAIAVGTLFGGWSLIKTLGGGFYRVRSIHSFSSQIASAAVTLGAALLGGPVSTTQVVGTAIMGAGSAERINQVRWGLIRRIGLSWLLTIPLSALMAGVLYLVINRALS